MTSGMVLLAIGIAGAATAAVLAQSPPGTILGAWDLERWLRRPVIATLMGRDPLLTAAPEVRPGARPLREPAHVRRRHPHRLARGGTASP